MNSRIPIFKKKIREFINPEIQKLKFQILKNLKIPKFKELKNSQIEK